MYYKKKSYKINKDVYSPFNIIRISNKYIVASISKIILAPFRLKLLKSLIIQKKELLSYEKMKFSRRLKFRLYDFFIKRLLKPNIINPIQNQLIKPIIRIIKIALNHQFFYWIKINLIKKKNKFKTYQIISKLKFINLLIKRIGFILYFFLQLQYINDIIIYFKQFIFDENLNNLIFLRNNFENNFLFYYYKYLYIHSFFIIINSLAKLLIIGFISLYKLIDFVALGQEWLCIGVIFNQIRHKILWGIISKIINNSIIFISLIKHTFLPIIFKKNYLIYINQKIFWKFQHIIYLIFDEIMMMTFDINILINMTLERFWSSFKSGIYLITNDIKSYSYFFGKQYGQSYWKRSKRDYSEIILVFYLFIMDFFTLFLKIILRYSYFFKKFIFCIYQNIWYIYAIIRVYIHMILFIFSYFYLMLDIKTQFQLKKNKIN
uniref:Uncharacterized protein n=1 Tax=Nitzschia sp. (in: diatoms) TaxID=1884248 RepID=A0A5J6DVX2_9STRA|nr:hypothetical protein [Nitzschia sp. (in: diatoms)]QES95316.1 hypothetical protein [Nitzschia sp. (in: diatoms)]